MKLPLPRYEMRDGDYCTTADVAALEAEYAKLRERAERAEKVVEALRSLHDGTFDDCCPLCDAIREYDAGREV
jgi:hypothetical protein